MTAERERLLNLEIDKVFHANDIIYGILTDPNTSTEEKTKAFGMIDRLIHTNKANNGAVCNAINLDRQAFKTGLHAFGEEHEIEDLPKPEEDEKPSKKKTKKATSAKLETKSETELPF